MVVAEMTDWVMVVQGEFVEVDNENVDCNYYSHDDDDWDTEMKEDVDRRRMKKVDEMRMNYYYEEALVDDWMKRM